jgi:excisionase family DNA binding protein
MLMWLICYVGSESHKSRMADPPQRSTTGSRKTQSECSQLVLFEVDTLGRVTSTQTDAATERPRAPAPRRVVGRRFNAKPADSLLSPEDVARRCGLSRKAVYRAVGRGELRAARILSRLRIDPRDVDTWIRANVVDAHVPVSAPPPPRLPAATGLRRLLPGQ